jgi:hypothetical protein
VPLVIEFAHTGLVRRFPTAILCTGLGVISVVCLATGLILDLIAHVRREAKRLTYLQHAAPRAGSIRRRSVRPADVAAIGSSSAGSGRATG